MSVTLAKKSDTHPVDVPFYPVIILADQPANGINPHAVRTAYAAELADQDVIVGAVHTHTFASLRAVAKGTGTLIAEGTFYAHPCVVRTPHTDGIGWVALADGQYLRASALLLITPARTL